jgi:hypothetical protein
MIGTVEPICDRLSPSQAHFWVCQDFLGKLAILCASGDITLFQQPEIVINGSRRNLRHNSLLGVVSESNVEL